MFQLIKIEYGRDNVPEPMSLPVAASKTITVGMALVIDSTTHTLTPASGDCSVTHIALENKTTKAGDYLLCYAVYPQMIFEVPLSAYSASTQVLGAQLQIATTGNAITATAASGTTLVSSSGTAVTTKFGAKIINTLGAKAVGDRVLVKLA